MIETSGGTIGIIQTPAGLVQSESPEARLLVRITGPDVGSAHYPWVMVGFRKNGSTHEFFELPTDVPPKSDGTYFPAVEMNGNTSVPENSYVEVVIGPDGESLLFSLCCQGNAVVVPPPTPVPEPGPAPGPTRCCCDFQVISYCAARGESYTAGGTACPDGKITGVTTGHTGPGLYNSTIDRYDVYWFCPRGCSPPVSDDVVKQLVPSPDLWCRGSPPPPQPPPPGGGPGGGPPCEAGAILVNGICVCPQGTIHVDGQGCVPIPGPFPPPGPGPFPQPGPGPAPIPIPPGPGPFPQPGPVPNPIPFPGGGGIRPNPVPFPAGGDDGFLGPPVTVFGEQIAGLGTPTSQAVLVVNTDGTITQVTAVANKVVGWDGSGNVGAQTAGYTEATVNTTDATTTTLLSTALDDEKQYTFEFIVFGRRTGGSAGSAGDSYTAILADTFKRYGGGAPVRVGAAASEIALYGPYHENLSVSFGSTVDVSGNSVRLRVTGDTNNNYTWLVKARINTTA